MALNKSATSSRRGLLVNGRKATMLKETGRPDLGVLLQDLGDHEGAVGAWRRTLEIDPDL